MTDVTEIEAKKTGSRFIFPEIGKKVRCRVMKATFSSAVLRVEEIEGMPSSVFYSGRIRGTALSENVFVCDTIKTGSYVECMVVGYADTELLLTEL
ncbi:hypothetical protein PAEPH01_1737 [Pancytospora epiphaga]|nr:hypothetical protein PAEPH01_1737 [Pancytospora epiphaga]